MALMQRDHEVEALAANGTDQSLAESVGLGRTRRRLQNSDSEIFDGLIQLGGKCAVAIMNQGAITMLAWYALSERLPGPVGGGMSRDIAVQNSARANLQQH